MRKESAVPEDVIPAWICAVVQLDAGVVSACVADYHLDMETTEHSNEHDLTIRLRPVSLDTYG